MKYFNSIDEIFQFIRTLPVEISIEQVKKWIEEVPPIKTNVN